MNPDSLEQRIEQVEKFVTSTEENLHETMAEVLDQLISMVKKVDHHNFVLGLLVKQRAEQGEILSERGLCNGCGPDCKCAPVIPEGVKFATGPDDLREALEAVKIHREDVKVEDKVLLDPDTGEPQVWKAEPEELISYHGLGEERRLQKLAVADHLEEIVGFIRSNTRPFAVLQKLRFLANVYGDILADEEEEEEEEEEEAGDGEYECSFGEPTSHVFCPPEGELVCPGCGCKPGDGKTLGCYHPDGCGYGLVDGEVPMPIVVKDKQTSKDEHRDPLAGWKQSGFWWQNERGARVFQATVVEGNSRPMRWFVSKPGCGLGDDERIGPFDDVEAAVQEANKQD